jgi:hypothetical protein
MLTPDSLAVAPAPAASTSAPLPPAAEDGGTRAPTTLVLRARTAPGRRRDPLIVADVRIPDGVTFSVVLLSDDLVRLPLELPVVARIPNGRGGAQLVPVAVRTDRSSDLGNVDVVRASGVSVVKFLPEIVRDPLGRRWLRPQGASPVGATRSEP